MFILFCFLVSLLGNNNRREKNMDDNWRIEVAKSYPTRKTRPTRPDLNPIRSGFFKKSNWPEPDPRRPKTRDNPRLKCPKPDPTWSEPERPDTRDDTSLDYSESDPNQNDLKPETFRNSTIQNLTRPEPEPERPKTRDDPRSVDPKSDPTQF
jgi:hypothetical protein